MSPTIQPLLSEIEACIERTQMSATAFGVGAVGDRAFVFRLRAGKGINSSTIDRVRRYIALHDAPKKKRAA